MADLTSLGELIKSEFNSLKAQKVKGKYDLPKNHFLKLYKVPVEPAPFIERTVSPEKEISFWDYKGIRTTKAGYWHVCVMRNHAGKCIRLKRKFFINTCCSDFAIVWKY